MATFRCFDNSDVIYPDHNKFWSLSNTTLVAIFPNLCLWWHTCSLCSNLGGIDPEKLYHTTLSPSWKVPLELVIVELLQPWEVGLLFTTMPHKVKLSQWITKYNSFPTWCIQADGYARQCWHIPSSELMLLRLHYSLSSGLHCHCKLPDRKTFLSWSTRRRLFWSLQTFGQGRGYH